MRFAFAASLLALISVPLSASTAHKSQPSLSAHEQQVWSAASHRAEFAEVPRTTRASCDASEPPEELDDAQPGSGRSNLGKN